MMRLTLGFVLLFTLALHADPLPGGRADRNGFSKERLERMHAMVESHISEGKHAGAVSAIVRNGRIVDLKTFGYRDLEKKLPMERDTIVRIYSMSKIVSSVATLQLIEEGLVQLDDPIGKYFPELAEMKVWTSGSNEDLQTVKQNKPITVRHLLTHTSGLPYDFSARQEVKSLYEKAALLESASMQDFITRVSKLPLVHQPGEAYTYGVNTDVLGALVEKVSGKSFEDYLHDRIFEPLEMKDTAFDVPEAKMRRVAVIYKNGTDGKLVPAMDGLLGSYAEKGKGFASGGAGLFSTADDYLRFAQALLNGGTLEGKTILSRKSVELMASNQLWHLKEPHAPGNPGEGFGYGVSVRLDGARGGLGSRGQFGWSGAATTYCNIDPQEKTVALLLVQHFPYNQHGIFQKFSTLFYGAMIAE